MTVIVPVKFMLEDGAKAPEYANDFAVGADLFAFLPEYDKASLPLSINPGKTVSIRTGVKVELPEEYELQIRSKSGLASKGLHVINSPGTIDPDYRGEIIILLHNTTYRMSIYHGQKIAQAVLAPRYRAYFVPTDSLSTTDRGEGGFGSTGK